MALHAVVRTDNLIGTDGRAETISLKYLGADGKTPTALDNGSVVKVGALIEGEREVFAATPVSANDRLCDVALIASPEVNYCGTLRDLPGFQNKAGAVCRAYRLHNGDVFSVTAEALTGEAAPAAGDTVELRAGTRLSIAKTPTAGATLVGRILRVDKGFFDYYVIEVRSPDSTATRGDRLLYAAPMALSETIDLGQKPVSDLIESDVRISAGGEVTGTLKAVSGWEEFSSAAEEQSGHYLPIHIGAPYGQKVLTVNDKKAAAADDTWILRVGSKDAKFVFKDGESEIFTLTFKGATLK